MNISELIYVKNAKEWRNWLSENYQSKPEIWLKLPHKDTGLEKIPYNDSVEQALCFGWIDSTVKSLDKDHSAQRFTPRRSTSKYSQQNKERLRLLAKDKKLMPEILSAVQGTINEPYIFPKDIIAEIKANPQAWHNWQGFSDSYKRIRVAYIDENRSNPDAFTRTLNNLIKKTSEGKQIGYGGIEKYF